MEGLVVLIALGILLAALVAPVLALVALSRSSRTLNELRRMQGDVRALEARISALAKLRAAATGAETGASRPEMPFAAPTSPPSPAAPAPPTSEAVPPGAPAPPVPRPVSPATPVPPATPPTPAAAGPVSPPPDTPLRPAAPPAPAGPLTTPLASPATTVRAPRPPRTGAEPPATPPPPAPPSPPAAEFDWESLLGLKGAAWMGGILIVIAGLFLAKLAVDAGWLTPVRRIAGMLLAGTGALVWAELSLRRGYQTTANAVSGAAVAVLYVAFYAGHALYGLFPMGLTFAMMALVTVLAGVLAVRYDAMFTAILGLLGGFATPVALSTGVDRPVGLFSYILLLNVGLLAVARRRPWSGLTLLGLGGTLLIELGWFGRFMSPEKMLVGLLAFLVFGITYLLLPTLVGRGEDPTLLRAGTVGGTAPFLFAVLLAGDRGYAGQWPLLFGYLGLLDAALVVVAVLRSQAPLLLAAALSTGVTLPLWAGQSLERGAVWGPTLAAVAITVILNLPRRFAARWAPAFLEAHGGLVEAGGLVATAGLALFALVMAARGFGEPPWAFLFLTAALFVLWVGRTGPERLAGAALLGAAALAVLCQVWFFRHTVGAVLLRNLAVPQFLTLALSLVAAERARRGTGHDEGEAGAVAANLVALVGLLGCLGGAELGADPLPLYAALAVAVALLVASALRTGWLLLLPTGLLASALFTLVWQESYFHPSDLTVVLIADTVFYLAFLALPFLVSGDAAASWRRRRLPWVTSALAGPAFFLPLYRAVSMGWGKAFIGVLPLLLAVGSVRALSVVARRFPASADPARAAARLRYLALFAAIALGFVAVAIPLQLDRQWITVGWALEALALWWLFGRLPHPGLKYFGAALLAIVGMRLLLNPEVLRYQERGWPILNWLLYTYGVPALVCFLGAGMLRRAEAARGESPVFDALPGDRVRLAPAAALLGLVLVFALINLEIVDYFSAGRYLEVSLGRPLTRDLVMSLAWGVYAMTLLVIGLVRQNRPLRFISLGFLLLTVAKVFLYDLSNLSGVYRVLSFFGLGVSLIAVSLLYQRFVLRRDAAR